MSVLEGSPPVHRKFSHFPPKNSIKKLTKEILSLLPSCLITAIAVDGILRPAGLVVSGITGISLLLNQMTGFPYVYANYFLTLAMVALARLFLGKQACAKIILLSILFPLTLILVSRLHLALVPHSRLLSCVLFSALYGGGIGMALKKGYSFGGGDTIALIIQKRLLSRLSVGQCMFLTDGLILLCCSLVFDRGVVLYGIFNQLVYARVIDVIMSWGNRSQGRDVQN